MKIEDIAKNHLEGKTCDSCKAHKTICDTKSKDNTCEKWSDSLFIGTRTYSIKPTTKKLKLKWTCETEMGGGLSEEDIKYIMDYNKKRYGK
jgi:hypothetical protein